MQSDQPLPIFTMQRNSALAIIFTLTICGCGSGNPQNSLEQKLANARTIAKQASVINVDGQWKKVTYEINNLNHEVAQNDSDNSPLTADVTFNATRSLSDNHDTKTAAEADNKLQPSVEPPENFNVKYRHQDGDWMIVEFTYTSPGAETSQLVDVDDSLRIVLWSAFR
ncbi:hypothetical protein [Calycomorphotria hydatis]|uniref:Uncharacterized protein n=1 Tax=Calycomorphotria hydatis TaxID=2528027 RepID=A0A517T9V4_9PLAN|nr:hypothetical protein [Calycomorphotria hydatis]QDT65154.1 hypothetical protein V22_24010 [Calycomorphotria hydatis]